MRKNYYYLAASLPELQLGYPPDIGFPALIFALKTNLSPEDYAKTVVMRRYYDIQNIRAFWMKDEFDPRGNFNANELEEALLTGTGFPAYVYDFLAKYDKLTDRLRYFSALIETYYTNEIDEAEDFLKEYLSFEREWRLVLTGFRAKIVGRDLAQELQFEDPHDDIIAQMMAQKDAKSYEPPSKYSDLKALFEKHKDAPMDLHKALCEYRFYKIEAMYGVDIFSLNRILAYMAQLIIVEKWLELDKKKGMQIVEAIVKEAI
jgi:hypothetical protein